MAAIPCLALVALTEKMPIKNAIEVIEEWVSTGLDVGCFSIYPKFK